MRSLKQRVVIHESSNSFSVSVSVVSGVSSMSKAKSQTFDPFADLGNLGSNLPGKTGQVACNCAFKKANV